MPHLIAVRHGRTQLNRHNEEYQEDGIFGGQYDTPLLPEGEDGAVRAGRKIGGMEDMRIQVAACSDLPRAKKTLGLMLREIPYAIPVEYSSQLRERCLGIFEGHKKAEILSSHPEYFTDPALKRFHADFEQHAPGGESFEDVTRRVRAEIERICGEHEGDILVVSHLHAIRCLLHSLLEVSTEDTLRLSIPNTTPIIIERSDPPRLVGEVTLEQLLKKSV
jgi:probable phosphoglycerate mutase